MSPPVTTSLLWYATDNTKERKSHPKEGIRPFVPRPAILLAFLPLRSRVFSLLDSFLFGDSTIFHSRSATTSLPLVVHSKVRRCPRIKSTVRVFAGLSTVNPSTLFALEVNRRQRTHLVVVYYDRMTNIQSPVTCAWSR